MYKNLFLLILVLCIIALVLLTLNSYFYTVNLFISIICSFMVWLLTVYWVFKEFKW